MCEKCAKKKVEMNQHLILRENCVQSLSSMFVEGRNSFRPAWQPHGGGEDFAEGGRSGSQTLHHDVMT